MTLSHVHLRDTRRPSLRVLVPSIVLRGEVGREVVSGDSRRLADAVADHRDSGRRRVMTGVMPGPLAARPASRRPWDSRDLGRKRYVPRPMKTVRPRLPALLPACWRRRMRSSSCRSGCAWCSADRSAEVAVAHRLARARDDLRLLRGSDRRLPADVRTSVDGHDRARGTPARRSRGALARGPRSHGVAGRAPVVRRGRRPRLPARSSRWRSGRRSTAPACVTTSAFRSASSRSPPRTR